jgi:SPP1 family predicted phage head-tail adaptor
MDRSNVISLVSTGQTQDAFGVWRQTETKRDVFCQVDSVTRAEFFEAGRSGLNPEYRFTLFAGDYNGESIVIFNGKAYSVYRTYHARTDEIELYVERKGGTNGKENVD